MKVDKTKKGSDACEVEPLQDDDSFAATKGTAGSKPALLSDLYSVGAKPKGVMDDGSVSTVASRCRTGDGSPLHEILAGGSAFSVEAFEREAFLSIPWIGDAQLGHVPGISTSFEKHQEGMASLDHELETLRFAHDEHLTYERDYHDPRRYYELAASDYKVETLRVDRDYATDKYYDQLQATQYANDLYDLDRRNRDYYDDLNRRR